MRAGSGQGLLSVFEFHGAPGDDARCRLMNRDAQAHGVLDAPGHAGIGRVDGEQLHPCPLGLGLQQAAVLRHRQAAEHARVARRAQGPEGLLLLGEVQVFPDHRQLVPSGHRQQRIQGVREQRFALLAALVQQRQRNATGLHEVAASVHARPRQVVGIEVHPQTAHIGLGQRGHRTSVLTNTRQPLASRRKR